MGKTWAPSSVDKISRMEKSLRALGSDYFWWIPETLSLHHGCCQENQKTDVPPTALLVVPVTKAELQQAASACPFFIHDLPRL